MVRLALLLVLASLCAACGQKASGGKQPTVDGVVQATATPPRPSGAAYTRAKDGKALSLPTNTPRLAVLIGNTTYDQAPRSRDGDTDADRLPPLTKPCSDVEAVATKLRAMGWGANEIYVLCEQSNEQISSAISALLAAAPLDPSKPQRLMILYLAGHGMLVDSRNYFFGVDTRINWSDKINTILKGMKTGPNYRLFEPYEGVDLYYQFSGVIARNDELRSPLLIIVDACRDNPFIPYIDANASDIDGLPQSDKLATEARWSLIKDRMSSLQKTTALPRGLEFLYATKANAKIKDDAGKGYSRLTQEFVANAATDVEIRKLIFTLEDRFKQTNSSLPLAEWQNLDHEGELYAGGDWCLFGCTYPGKAMPAASARLNGSPKPASWAMWLIPAAAAATRPSSPAVQPGKVTVVRDYAVAAPRRVLVDVLWCSGDELGPARFADANAFASRLGERLDGEHRQTGQSRVYGIRLREITAAQNNMARFQRRADTLYVDNVHAERDENQLAVKYIRPLVAAMPVRTTDWPTKDYIEVSFCRLAYKGVRAPRIYVQILNVKSSVIASELMTIMDRASSDLSTDPTADNMSRHPGFRIADYPRRTELRVQTRATRARAILLAETLRARLGYAVPVKCIARCAAPKATSGIELWVGSDD